MNNSITIKKNESVVKSPLKNNISGLNGLIGEFYYQLKEKK